MGNVMTLSEKKTERDLKAKKLQLFGTLQKFEEFADEWDRACGKPNRSKQIKQ